MAACERCGAPFEVTHPMKRFCSERCQRQSEKERYRARHTEEATCKRCGRSFERVVIGQRKKVYCSLECQYEARSVEYRQRPDLRRRLERARRLREAKRNGPRRTGVSM
jgi:FPG/IleRS zinc finger protein